MILVNIRPYKRGRLALATLGLKPGARRKWFMVRLGRDDWYSNDHVMLDRAPVRGIGRFFGPRHHRDRRRRPDGADILKRMFCSGGTLTPVRPMRIARSMTGETIVVLGSRQNEPACAVARHYDDLVMHLYPRATRLASDWAENVAYIEHNRIRAVVACVRCDIPDTETRA